MVALVSISHYLASGS